MPVHYYIGCDIEFLKQHPVYWGIDRKDKRVIAIVGRFLRIVHYGKTINQNLRDEYN